MMSCSKQNSKCRKTVPFAAFTAILLSACGGGGGNAGGSPPPPSGVNCPTNQIASGGTCVCPAGLSINGDEGYCTDPGVTVLRGAQFLEPGFPVEIPVIGGFGFLPLYMKVGNMDADPQLELAYKRIGSDFWAWNHDGTVLNGYPVWATTFRHGKMLMAQLDNDPNLELFIGHEGTAQQSDQCELNAFDDQGTSLPGWPVTCQINSNVTVQPVAVDFDGNGRDEIIFLDDDSVIRRLDETYTVSQFSPQSVADVDDIRQWCGLAAGDLDSDGVDEIVGLSCSYTDFTLPGFPRVQRIYAFDRTGAVFANFPVQFLASREHQPLIGDVDNDGSPEIIAIGGGSRGLVIISSDGQIENEIDRSGLPSAIGDTNYPFLSLADMNSDGAPEIIFQQGGQVHVIDGQGNSLPGFPVASGIYFAVGDVDGDNSPDVVTMLGVPTQLVNDPRVDVVVYSNAGAPKSLELRVDSVGIEGGIMPVLADIDADGRNEILVIADEWQGFSGVFPQIWAFDLGGGIHGDIEWGQQFGNPANTGEYRP